MVVSEVLRTFAEITGAGPAEVLPWVTENPHELLAQRNKSLFAPRGKVSPGFRADLIALDDHCTVRINFNPQK